MTAREFILKKRSGQAHDARELKTFLDGFLSGEVKDYQVAAWLMAVYFKGMTPEETRDWTRLMWKSGRSFPRATRHDFWVDKHSTGGVGDKTSLLLVPWVATLCRRLFGEKAVRLPMVSGRGLGHTGGTLDKLEAVPGFSPRIPFEKATDLLNSQGHFMMGQTDDMAPADRVLYALRDVTGTVESLPLIVSSILSKKLSESLDGLVLDVKSGAGAFMKTQGEAQALARGLIDVARGERVDTVAVLTSMEEPLGWKVGHQLEIEECADFLQGKTPERGLWEVTMELAAWMVRLASRGTLSLESSKNELKMELESGRPFAEFRRMFEAQGGNYGAFEENRARLPEKYKRIECKARSNGWISAIEAGTTGMFVTGMGGGRMRKDDQIDFRVGVEFAKKCGDEVRTGDTVAWVICPHTKEKDAALWVEKAVQVSAARPAARRWILGVVE